MTFEVEECRSHTAKLNTNGNINGKNIGNNVNLNKIKNNLLKGTRSESYLPINDGI